MLTKTQKSYFTDYVDNLTISELREGLPDLCEWINTEIDPVDVYDESKLADWARENGYALAEEQ